MRVPSKPVTSGHEVQEWCLATQHRLARLGKPRKHVARPWPLFSVCWVFKLIFSWKVYGETCPIWKVYGEIWNVVWMFFFSSVFGSAIIWRLALATWPFAGMEKTTAYGHQHNGLFQSLLLALQEWLFLHHTALPPCFLGFDWLRKEFHHCAWHIW